MAQEFNLGALGQFLSIDITGNNISFAANNLTVGNSTVNSSFNSTGAYTTGTVNATAHTIGTTWVANASGVYMTMPLSANGGTGTAGQLLYSNGATGSPYWAAAPANYTISTGLVNTTGTITVNASYIATIAANNASYLGGVAATNYLRTDSSKDITEFVYLRFGSANQSDGNDGKIGAGLFSNGFNIVGTQTQNGNGREISYYGKLWDRSAAGASILGPLTTGNTITVGTSAYFVANGNFGIGTASPGGKLDVQAGNTYFTVAPATYTSAVVGPRPAGDGISSFILQANSTIQNKFDSSSGGIYVYANTATFHTLFASNGNIGIANTAPSVKLHVTGNSYISGGLSIGTTSFNRKVNFANGEMTFIPYTAAEGASTNTYFINVSDATGNYGNSMTLNFRALYSSGASSGTLAAITMNTTLLGVTGDVYTAYSDERLKDILGPIDNALSKVQSLTGFYYQPNKTAISLGIEKNQLNRVGVSAQKVREVLPEAVGPAPINEKYLTVQYEKIVPLLIEAIKELSIKIEKLEQRVS